MASPGIFTRMASWTARACGHPIAFFAALLIIVIWLASGPLFHWNNAWQLVINTWTNVLTLMIVFLIQHSQNRDSDAAQIKLNEIIRALEGAHNVLLNLDRLSNEQLEQVRARYGNLAEQAQRDVERGKSDTGSPQVKVD